MSRLLVLAAIAASFVLSVSAPADAQWLRNRLNGNGGGNFYGNRSRIGNSDAYGYRNAYGFRNAYGTNNVLPVNNGCSYQNQQASPGQLTSEPQSQYQQNAANLRLGPAPAAAAKVELNSSANDIFSALSAPQQQSGSVQPATFDAPVTLTAPATNEAPLKIAGPAASNSASVIGTGISALESISTDDAPSELPEAKSVLDLED